MQFVSVGKVTCRQPPQTLSQMRPEAGALSECCGNKEGLERIYPGMDSCSSEMHSKRDREMIPITCLCFVSPNPPNDKIMFSQPNLLNQHKCKAVGAFTTMLCHKRIINVSTVQLNKRTLEVNEIVYLHQACQQCKERKGRCDGGQPCCSYCSKHEKHCIYTVRRRRGPGKR
jgi:hypothetical protein